MNCISLLIFSVAILKYLAALRNSHSVYFSWVKEQIWVPGTGIDICGAWIYHHRLWQHWAEAGPEAEPTYFCLASFGR